MAKTDTRITTGGNAEKIDQHVLETFVSGKFHWQGLSPEDQKKMARELLDARAFFMDLKNAWNY